MFLSRVPVGPVKPKPKAVRRANPILDARNAQKAAKRMADQRAAADAKRKEIKENNTNIKKREKALNLETLKHEVSTLKLPKSWLAPQWPYEKNETNDVDLSLATVDDVVVSSKTVPRRMLDVTPSCLKDDGEFEPWRHFNTTVNRIFAIAPNGAPTLVRVHGMKDKFYTKVPKSLSRHLMKQVFDYDEPFMPLNHQWRKDPNAPKGTPPPPALNGPAGDPADEKDPLNGPQGPPGAHEGNSEKFKYAGDEEFITSFNNKPERDARDAFLKRHALAQQVCREAQVELERRLTREESLRWKTGDFNHAMVLNVDLKMRQRLMEYDFDEQELYFEFTVAFPDLLHHARKALMEDGLTLLFERYTFATSDFFNYKFNSHLNFLVQQRLSGQSWFTLPGGKYISKYGMLPIEQRHDYDERVINDSKKRKHVRDPETEEEEKEEPGGKKLRNESGDGVIVEEDVQYESEEGSDNSSPMNMSDSDPSEGPGQKTWYRAEFDIHYKDLISHHNSKEPKYNTLAPFRKLYFDLEVETPKGGGFCKPGSPDPDENDPGCKIFTISLDFEISPGKIVQGIFTWKSSDQKWKEKLDLGPDVFVWEFESEEDMLQGWADFARNCQFTLLGGHNISKFDIPFLLDRAHTLGMNNFPIWTPLLEFSRIKENLFESKARGQELVKNPCIPGVIILDTYHWARNEKKYPSNTLNYVAFKILKKTKDDVDYKMINGLFYGTKEQKERLCRYNLKDSSLPREIVDEEQIIFGETEIARVTGITIEMYNVRGQSVKTESRLYRLTDDYGFLVPHDKSAGKTPEEVEEELKAAASGSVYKNTLHGFGAAPSLKTEEERLNERKARQSKYEGATCLEPKRGYYKVPISVLDFASLYPSIMIAHNLCYSTIIRDKSKLSRLSSDDYTIVRCDRKDEKGNVKYTLEYVFVKKHIRRGLMPLLVKTLVDTRKVLKNEIEEAEEGSVLYHLLNKRSTALKLSANAAYGFMAAETIPCIAVSESVCNIGRNALLTTVSEIETWFSPKNPEYIVWLKEKFPDRAPDAPVHQAEVVYGDTDSVMIKFGVATLQESNVLAEEAMRRCNLKFVALPPMKLDHEKEYFPFALMEKKTYSALKYAPFKYNSEFYTYNAVKDCYEPAKAGDYVPTHDTKGAETERRDKIGFVKRTLKRQWNIALWEQDPEKAAKYARTEVEKLARGDVDMAELIKSQSTRLSYTSLTPAATIAAKSKARGNPIASGERVFYVRVKLPEKQGIKRKRFDEAEKTSIEEMQAAWERGSAKTSEAVEDPKWIMKHHTPIDYKGILLSDVVNAYSRAHNCFLTPEQRASVWEPLTSGETAVDADIQQSGPMDMFTKKGARCNECRVPLKTLPPQDETGGVTIHKRRGRKVLCDEHADHYEELKKEYEDKIAENTEKCNDLWSRCATCVGPQGDAEACNSETCPIFWVRTTTRQTLEVQKIKLKTIMDW